MISRAEARVIATALMLTERADYIRLQRVDPTTVSQYQRLVLVLQRSGFPHDQDSCRLIHEFIREDYHD